MIGIKVALYVPISRDVSQQAVFIHQDDVVDADVPKLSLEFICDHLLDTAAVGIDPGQEEVEVFADVVSDVGGVVLVVLKSVAVARCRSGLEVVVANRLGNPVAVFEVGLAFAVERFGDLLAFDLPGHGRAGNVVEKLSFSLIA